MPITIGTRQGRFPLAGRVSHIPRDACGWPRVTPNAAMAVCQDINRIRWFSVLLKKDISNYTNAIVSAPFENKDKHF